MKSKLEGKKVTCRLCKGPHFTTKCPYRETLAGLGVGGGGTAYPYIAPTDLANPPPIDNPDDGVGAPQNEPAPIGASTSGKYVPPSMRAGAGRGAGESMGRPGGNRDDLPTLRVTNVSEDAIEDDLRELFSRFGRVARVFIGKDRETGIGKGYAFVSFEDRAAAERAMAKVDGIGESSSWGECVWNG